MRRVPKSGLVLASSHADAMALGAKCRECPLFMASTKPVLGSGSVVAQIAVVGDYPTFEEVRQGVWTSKGAETYESLIGSEGPGRAAIYLDNAVACPVPEGDLRVFNTKVRKELRARKRVEDFRSPVDCCRPRLFSALGVRRCGTCLKWETGPTLLTCACGKRTQWLPQGKNQRTPEVVQAAGNYALESLVGVTGIQKWRGSPVDMVERARMASVTVVAAKPTVALVEAKRKKAMSKVSGRGKRVKKKVKFNPRGMP